MFMENNSKSSTWYFNWKQDLIKDLQTNSAVLRTSAGDIEYAVKGNSGPVITGFHESPGGYDQSITMYNDLFYKGFRFIAWSRPGYLRTPITVGRTFDQQADALIPLLDHFKVAKTALVASSTGAPVALQFAIRHPDRVWAIILINPVSQKYDLNSSKKSEKFISKMTFNDPTIYLYNLFTKYATSSVVKSIVKMESDFDNERLNEEVDKIMSSPKKLNAILGLIRSMSPISIRAEGLQNDIYQCANIVGFDFKKITAPMLIVRGKHDADVTLHHSGYITSNVKHAELYTVEDAFHIMNVSDSHPKTVQKKLDFLAKYKPY